MAFALFVYLLALVCWLGSIIFFSFFTAPVVFGQLAVHEAGKVVGAIFPLYYDLGYIAGAISLAMALLFALTSSARAWWTGCTIALALALGLTLYAGLVVRPRTQAVRSVVEETNPDPARKAEFDSLHRFSVQLNVAVLLLDLAALAGSAIALSRNA